MYSGGMRKKKIVHYTTTDGHKRVNAAYLIGSYAVSTRQVNKNFHYIESNNLGKKVYVFLYVSNCWICNYMAFLLCLFA